MNKNQLVESLLEEAKGLNYNDGNLDKVKSRSEMVIKKVFGNKSEYVGKLNKIDFFPGISFGGMDKGIYSSSFNNGKTKLVNLINVMLEDLNLTAMVENVAEENRKPDATIKLSENIFIVHGHNEEIKQSLARFLEKIDLKPVILHEQPSKGKTIIEKFTDLSNVSFALVILSGDDIAFAKNDDQQNAKLRARQNVILELGFFLGKLGRENVVVLYEELDNFEIPSDYQGVLCIPYDKSGNWRLAIAKELKAVGYKIDGNKLLE